MVASYMQLGGIVYEALPTAALFDPVHNRDPFY